MNASTRPTRRHPRVISMFMLSGTAIALGLLALIAPSTARAADHELTITIKDHKFQPASPEIPAGVRVKLTVINADPTAEEFESRDFHVEKIVGGGKTISAYIGPLDAGTYKFFGERHEKTAQGVLTVK